jgi:hypothetical protein
MQPDRIMLVGGPGHLQVVGELARDQETPLDWGYTDWVPGEGFITWSYVRDRREIAGILVYRYTGLRIPPDPRLELEDG